VKTLIHSAEIISPKPHLDHLDVVFIVSVCIHAVCWSAGALRNAVCVGDCEWVAYCVGCTVCLRSRITSRLTAPHEHITVLAVLWHAVVPLCRRWRGSTILLCAVSLLDRHTHTATHGDPALNQWVTNVSDQACAAACRLAAQHDNIADVVGNK